MNTEILLVCGDFYHPAHIPSKGLAFLSECGYDLTVKSDYEGVVFSDYAAVILARGDSFEGGERRRFYTEEQAHALGDYVKNGGSLLALHAGLTCDSETIRTLAGCRFLYHPEQCIVRTAPVNRHMAADGVEPFEVKDEHYVVELYDTVTPLFASSSEGLLNIAGYYRPFGSGKVCAFTPGHNPEVFENAQFRKVIVNMLGFLTEGECSA